MTLKGDIARLRLMQLVSPSLPVGAYSYSEGLEALVQGQVLRCEADLNHWLYQELTVGTVRLDGAIALRVYDATIEQDWPRIHAWNAWFTATRDTEELRNSSLQMGRALLRLVGDLGLPIPALLQPDCNFVVAFAYVAACWEIDRMDMLLGYLHSWASNLISASVKLVPLGQTAGQRVLLTLEETIAQIVPELCHLSDDELAGWGWGVAIASMQHETLYSRLFRS